MKRLVLYPCLFLIMSFRFTGDILAQNSIYREVQATQPALAQVVYSDALFAEDKSNTRSDEFSQVVKKSTILTLNLNELKRLNDPGIEKLELKLPYDRKSLELTFIKTQLLTDDFTVISDKSNGNPVPVSRGTFYRGVLKDDPNSIATLSIFDDQLVGIVSTDSGNIVLGQLGEEYTSEYIMYNDLDLLVPFSFECETPDVAPNSDLAEEIRRIRDNNTPSERTTKCVRMYLELDYTLVNEKGGIQGAVNWMTAVYNQVQAFYSINSISTGISQIFTWTTEDPYNLGSTGEALNKFRLERPSYNGDLAHLISRGAPTGGGVAYLDVLCSNLGYAYSYVNSGYNNVPTYSWTINVIAHETGHNFGSPHTHSCSWSGGAIDGCGPAAGYSGGNCAAGPIPSNGGTIMSYCHLLPTGINFTLGFGPLPSQLVIQKINNAACLSSSCTSSQVTVPSMVSASDGLYTDKVRITWSGSSGNYFKVYRNTSNVSSSSTAITGWQTSTTYDDSNASPAVTYWYFVRAASNNSGATMSSFSTGDSGWRSASTTVTVPVSVSASDGTYSDKVRITWSGTSGNYFRVFRNTSNTTTNATVISGWQNTQLYFDDTNAAPTTTYYYFVQAASSSSGANASAYSTINSGWRSASTTVTVPVSVSASDGTYSDKVRITWSGTSGNYFRVFRNTSNTTTNATVISVWQNSQMTFDDTNAAANTTYYYFVQAASSSTGTNASAYSAINSGWRSASTTVTVPVSVSASDGTYSDKVRITWSGTSGNYFRVFRNTSNTTTNATVISGWQNSQMVFDDTNAAANTTYYYFVQAASSSTGTNASAYSSINSGWRSASTTVTIPVSVSASDGTYSDKVRITWSGTSGNYFRVFRNTSNTTTNATVISGWQNTQMYFDDTNAAANITYYYFVQAASSSSGANASAYSSINSGWRSQSCGTPTNLAVSQITNYSATLTWSTVSGATQYSVWYNSSTGWTQIGTVTSNTANITGLSGGINYCFVVKAICGTIVGNLSASKCFTTPASSPDNTISHTGNDNNGIIMVAESAINTIMIYPNPATNNSEITVEFKSELNTTATVTLFNATGQSVINKLVPIIIGDNILQISAPDAPGVYMFKLQTGKDSYFIKKLVITAN